MRSLPLLYGRLWSHVRDETWYPREKSVKRTLSDSLVKKTAPLPTPRVPFFFLPFLSISEIDQVWMSSALALLDVAATRSAGST